MVMVQGIRSLGIPEEWENLDVHDCVLRAPWEQNPDLHDCVLRAPMRADPDVQDYFLRAPIRAESGCAWLCFESTHESRIRNCVAVVFWCNSQVLKLLLYVLSCLCVFCAHPQQQNAAMEGAVDSAMNNKSSSGSMSQKEAREARRRKILERGSDRLAFITGEIKSVPPTPPSSQSRDCPAPVRTGDTGLNSLSSAEPRSAGQWLHLFFFDWIYDFWKIADRNVRFFKAYLELDSWPVFFLQSWDGIACRREHPRNRTASAVNLNFWPNHLQMIVWNICL
jgi:hypothetical protein